MVKLIAVTLVLLFSISSQADSYDLSNAKTIDNIIATNEIAQEAHKDTTCKYVAYSVAELPISCSGKKEDLSFEQICYGLIECRMKDGALKKFIKLCRTLKANTCEDATDCIKASNMFDVPSAAISAATEPGNNLTVHAAPTNANSLIFSRD